MLEQVELWRLLDYNPDTGVFTARVRRGKRRAGEIEGCLTPDGYVQITINGRHALAHRLAFVWMTGACPHEVDHINGVRDDNRWANLREASRAHNMQNLGAAKRSNRTSGLLGCHLIKHTGRFAAQITVNKKVRHLGSFDTAEQAHAAYLKAKHELHPTHQRLRTPPHQQEKPQ